MGGSLTRVITDASKRGYGVNLLERFSPAPVVEAGTSIIGIVGHFPWGPRDVLTECGSIQEVLDTFAPSPFAASRDTTTFPALLGLMCPWPSGIRVVRIPSSGGAEKADVVIDTKVTVTAKYHGTAGNEISAEVTAASGGDGAKRDLVIRIGTAYEARYKDLNAAGFAAVDDPYVDVAQTGLPAITAEADLTGGLDGNPASTDYTPATGVAGGLNLFEADDADASVVFIAGVATGLVDNVNAAIKTFAAATQKPLMVVYCTPFAASASTIRTKVSTLRHERTCLPWPRVQVADPFDEDLTVTTTDGNADLACAMVNVAPERSPGGSQGTPFLGRIVALESTGHTRVTLDAVQEDGVDAFFISRELGTIIRGGRTTDTNVSKRYIFRRRMSDFIARSLAEALEWYAEMPIDFVIASGRVNLGEVTGAEVGVVANFLESLVLGKRIAAYTLDYQTGNTAENKALGVFQITIAVELYGIQEAIILAHTIGPGLSLG